MRALAVQMQIEIGEQRREAIGVVEFCFGAVPEFEAEAICSGVAIDADREKDPASASCA